MNQFLTFAEVHHYDTREPGITVTATLRCGDEVVDVEAKVDTGASHSIFKRTHGEMLGVNIEAGDVRRIGTVTGSFVAYGHEVTLSVLGIETAATVYFAADEQFTRNVLGRTGWLDRLRLGLVDHDGQLYLSHYNDPA